MTLTVLLPTTVAMPDSPPEGTRYVPYDPYTPLPEEHLDAEVLGVWGNPERQLADAARRLRNLRLVQLFSAGSDNAARAGFDPGVVIASGRGLHDRPVAEHTLTLVLAAARRLHRAFAAQRDHEWATDIGGIQPEPSPGVFSTPDSPLWDTPNLIITPHAAGGRPLGALDLLAENVNALLTGRPLRNVVG